MIIKELIEELKHFEDTLDVHGYEGEDEGIRIDCKCGNQVAFISTWTGETT